MRWRPLLLSALAVTALLALVAAAAGTRPLGAAGSRSGSVPSSLFDYLLTTMAIVMFAAFVVVAIALPFGVTSGERRSSPSRVLRTIIVVILFLFATVMLRHFIVDFLHQLRAIAAQPGKHGHGGGGTTGTLAHNTRPSGTPNFRWDEVLVVAGLVLFIALLAFGLRPPARGREDSGSAETLAEAISESLDDLRADPDLRRAIEAAYARMERALALIGVPRDPAEAPEEYLERALLSVDASAGAVRRLTELFEHVKFSHHEPDSRMRDDAIDALVAIRDELRAGKEVAA